jgi:DNA polymerase-3 subunit delta'
MSDPADAAPVAPWLAAQTRTLIRQRGHAWLLQGPAGLGHYALALSLASAWLCEAPTADGACGHCPSCHSIAVRTHADLRVLMPETHLLELGWPLGEKAQQEIDDKARKASREIRVDAVREAVEFCQRTNARNRGKVVLVFPAEDMNRITANALLKTLEEPPGDTRFILASQAAHRLLPTVRSRCMVHTLAWPDVQASAAWLSAHGLPASQAAGLLRASGGRPALALQMAQAGQDAAAWARFPRAMAAGDVLLVKDWSAAQLVDALQKLCHDLCAVAVGAPPRYFDPADLPSAAPVAGLLGLGSWDRELRQTRQVVDHPWNAGLMTEALVGAAKMAMRAASPVPAQRVPTAGWA